MLVPSARYDSELIFLKIPMLKSTRTLILLNRDTAAKKRIDMTLVFELKRDPLMCFR